MAARERPWIVPRATYRLQLHAGFPLSAATALVPYLHRLGISHVYLSPLLKSRRGSTHGYDVIDHSVLDPELGTERDLRRLAALLHQHEMGIIVDVVPNHMAILTNDNVWWLDVLENGPAARSAKYFDIDWNPARSGMRNRLLVPVLGESLGAVLLKGEIKVEHHAATGEFSLRYFDHRFPLDPREYPRVLACRPLQLPARDRDRSELMEVLAALAHLPAREETLSQAQAVRYRVKDECKRRLAQLWRASEAIKEHVANCIEAINGTPADPSSFEPLAQLLDAQAYRLAFWRVAGDEINYRRFFDVNQLAALRMDRPGVFEATHALILGWIGQGIVDGLRIDHPDGLYDPQRYFEQLQAPFADSATQGSPLFYVVAEKILADYERLPAGWAVHGDTGYEFGATVLAWLVDKSGEQALTRLYRAFTGERGDFGAIAVACRRQVMRTIFAAEISMLTQRLDRLAQQDRRTADFTVSALQDALVETIANFPVYRTYVSARGAGDEDRKYIQWAVALARKSAPHVESSVFDFLHEALLGRGVAGPQDALEFAMKFQQVTSPVSAKGVEDTALYRYNRLVALNEVGADPRRFGATSAAVHQSNLERARRWPHTLLGTSTHDSKRSEDVRARIAVLSEMPERWRTHLKRWSRLNRAKRLSVDGAPAPSRNDEYLLYQTLLGIFSTDDGAQLQSRTTEYAIKAARESKAVTSWINPHAGYETALSSFIESLLAPHSQNAFLRDLESLCGIVSHFGLLNSLSLTLLKLTCPGVPDFYQGMELPEPNLVDPDSRRPVDFARRQALLERFEGQTSLPAREHLLSDLLEHCGDGRIKMFVCWQLLQLRQRHASLFAQGQYEALTVSGTRADHLCAFVRSTESEAVVVVAPRWFAKLCGEEPRWPLGVDIWQDTRIHSPPGLAEHSFAELFTGREMSASAMEAAEAGWAAHELLARFPLAVLYQNRHQPFF